MNPEPRKELIDPKEGLLRFGYQTPKNKCSAIVDQKTGRKRPPAAAFEPRKKDEALSVNVESSLISAELPLTWGANQDRQYVARITVHDCLSNNLHAFADPLPGNPHHGLIFGLVEMRASDPDQYELAIDALAKASSIVDFA